MMVNASAKGAIIKRLLENGIKARKEFLKTGAEIERYGFSRNFDFEYSAAADADLSFKAKVAKTAQYLDVVGSALYQTNPDRQVNPRRWVNEIQRVRAKLMKDYLNYTPSECDLYGHQRRCVTDALVYGRGVMWTGWNDRKKLIQSYNDTVDNLLVDPDARIAEEMGWVGRRRVRPRVELLEAFTEPDSQMVIKGLKATHERKSDEGKDSDWTRQDYGADQIEYWECYFRNSLTRYKGGIEVKESPDAEEDPGPRKYCVTKDGEMFAEEDWEIPFFLDNEWPCTVLDFRERPGCIWPTSPLEVGLGHQRALNWLYTLYLSKAHTTTRTIIAVVTQNGQGPDKMAVNKVLRGKALEFIALSANGDQGDINHFFQQLDFKLNVEDFVALNQIISHEFEEATGLTEFLASGFGATQARSAEEVKIKDVKSRTRIEDFRAILEKHSSKLARKEAMAARYFCDPEDIEPILGKEAAQLWGQVMPPLAEQLAQVRAGTRAIQDVSETGIVFAEWLRECDYDIVAGSLRRKDIDQAIDAADAAMNQLVPTLITEGGIGPAAAIIADWSEKKGLSPEVSRSVMEWAQSQQQEQTLKTQMEMKTLELQVIQAQIQLQQLTGAAPGPGGGPPQPGGPAQPMQPQPAPMMAGSPGEL